MSLDLIIKKVTLSDADIHLAINMMLKLSEYQKIEDVSMITPVNMRKLLSENAGEAVFGYIGETPVAFMYYYYNYPVLIGEKCIYIDSLYIEEGYRSQGIGNQMLKYIAAKALDEGCRRLEWTCLNWNEPALKFYDKIGAIKADNISLHRVPYGVIAKIAESNNNE